MSTTKPKTEAQKRQWWFSKRPNFTGSEDRKNRRMVEYLIGKLGREELIRIARFEASDPYLSDFNYDHLYCGSFERECRLSNKIYEK